MTSTVEPYPAAITADLHPFVPPDAGNEPSPISALRVACAALPDGSVRLAYTLEGRIRALRIPVKDAPNAHPLWQHTCFEAFLSVPGDGCYREYNFSPAGLWAASAFRRYREIERELTGDAPPVIQTEQRDDALRLTAWLPPALLPGGRELRAGLSAVIERGDGQLEYWALHHPLAGRADFHHRGGWTLGLTVRRTQP